MGITQRFATENHVATELNNITLDKTLSIEDVPADAKAVGDALANISGDGLSSTEKNLLLSLLKSAAYTADMSATIVQLETLWSETPDAPETGVEQSGSVLSIVSGVTASQSDSVLAIA